MSDSIKIFFLGSTGYLGGQLLQDVLESKLAQQNKLEFTLISRSVSKINEFIETLKKEHGDKIAQHTFTAKAVSHDQTDEISKLASTSDVVLQIADSDNTPLTSALNAGLKQHKNVAKVLKRGKPIHIHVSGTAVIADDANGEHNDQEVFDDLDVKRVWDLPKQAFHHEQDLEIRRAGREDGIDTAIIMPPLLYGLGRGLKQTTRPGAPFFQLLMDRKVPGTVGPGRNEWTVSHVRDVSSALLHVTEAAVRGEADVNEEGIYFTADQLTFNLKDYILAIAKEIEKQRPGSFKSLEPAELTEEEKKKWLGSSSGAPFGGNSLSITKRTPKLGWKAEWEKKETIWQTMPEEVKVVLANEFSK